MKTSLEYHEKLGCFKSKISYLSAIFVNGDKRERIGECEVDLADFHLVGRHSKTYGLTNLMEGVSQKSYVSLCIDT